MEEITEAFGFSPIKELTIILTEACNASCTFCTQKHNRNNDMTEERLWEILREAQTKFPNSLLRIDLFGGEALLNFDIIKEVFSRYKYSNIWEINLFTNGILLNQEVYDFCVKHEINIIISNDGLLNKEQRGYEITDEVKRIIRQDTIGRGIITVNFGVHKNAQIKQTYQYLEKEYNLTPKNINFYFNRNHWEWSQEDIDQFGISLLDYLMWVKITGRPLANRVKEYFKKPEEKWGCMGGVNHFAYSQNGEYECGSMDLGTDPIVVPKQDFLEEFCSGCPIKERCPKSCSANLKLAGTQDNAQCQLHKIIVKSLDKLWKEE